MAIKSASHQMAAQMLNRAKQGVLESTQWLSRSDIARLTSVDGNGAADYLSEWLRERQIFSISHNGGEYFPSYALNGLAGYRPIEAMTDILHAFGATKDSWGVAFWFASVNSYLGGKRPQDLLATDPDQVVAAAFDERQGVPHG
ncbi:hypothetical protein D9M69_513600 [compost metagenome]